MKAVLLAGGFGTRICEESSLIPKPMIEIGGKPMLWHIMKIYSHYGIHDFVICLGYKGYLIKEYFANYCLHTSNITISLASNHIEIHEQYTEPWRVTLIDTGLNTMTGGRLKMVQKYIGNEAFCFTYGDGVSDVNIEKLIHFHRGHGKHATVTAIQPPGRYGALHLDGQRICSLQEKFIGNDGWINGGFFILEPHVFDLIEGPDTVWEQEPMQQLILEQQLMSYCHSGYWQAMDTLLDKKKLESLWTTTPPWKVWLI